MLVYLVVLKRKHVCLDVIINKKDVVRETPYFLEVASMFGIPIVASPFLL
jgi:hypothetical protein